jgi:hypothetical protein
MRLGELARLTDRLKTLGFSGTLNTAFVERINLTLRHAACGGVWPPCRRRRSWATAQLTGALLAHLEWRRAYYHFCRPHLSLHLQLNVPQARRGKQTPRPYGPRTPARAVGLTDRLWSVEELLAFPVGQ